MRIFLKMFTIKGSLVVVTITFFIILSSEKPEIFQELAAAIMNTPMGAY